MLYKKVSLECIFPVADNVFIYYMCNLTIQYI